MSIIKQMFSVKKVGTLMLGILLFSMVLGLCFAVGVSAQDADIASGTSAITTYGSENKAQIISYYTTLALLSLGISLVILLLLKGMQWIKRAFVGGGRRKR